MRVRQQVRWSQKASRISISSITRKDLRWSLSSLAVESRTLSNHFVCTSIRSFTCSFWRTSKPKKKKGKKNIQLNNIYDRFFKHWANPHRLSWPFYGLMLCKDSSFLWFLIHFLKVYYPLERLKFIWMVIFYRIFFFFYFSCYFSIFRESAFFQTCYRTRSECSWDCQGSGSVCVNDPILHCRFGRNWKGKKRRGKSVMTVVLVRILIFTARLDKFFPFFTFFLFVF